MMTNLEVMKMVQDGKMTPEDAAKLLSKPKALRLKVSTKGAVQLDGLRRFPVTLYAEEWRRVLAMQADILKFIEDNRDHLTEKSGNE
jgi:hypothetical protein